MLQARKNYKIIIGGNLSGAVLILAQLVACGPSVESGSGTQNSGGGGGAGAGTTGGSISACDCLASYGGASMGDDALMTLRDQGLKACFHNDDPAVLDMERTCLPSVVGQHAANGRDIEVYYFCSDLCPDYGHVGIRFSGVEDTPACCAIGGIPLRDPSWGGFEACVPSEINPMGFWVDKCP